MTADNRKTYDFLIAAAERLQAGQPIFNLTVEKAAAPTKPASNVGYQDEGWKKYLAGDPKRAPVWEAWYANRTNSDLTAPDDMSFNSFVQWWKSEKADRRFTDRNIGGYAATIQRLKAP